MDLAEALDLAVAKTGVRRYRQLCDPTHPAYHPEYIPLVLAIARGEPLPVPKSGLAIALEQWWHQSVDLHRAEAWRKHAEASGEPIEAASAPASELDALAIVARCPFARLCTCIHRGNIDCQPGGKHPGERRTVTQCRECLASWNP